MPAIIPKDKEDLWLDPKATTAEQLLSLLKPYPSDKVEFYRVSSIMNKPESDSPEVIFPIK